MTTEVSLDTPGGAPIPNAGSPSNPESFCCSIPTGVKFQIESGGGYPGNPGSHYGRGALYLSNQRIVFVTSPPQRYFKAFSMPLVNIREEKYNQPFFGANNFTGKLIPMAGSTELLGVGDFSIQFKEGGESEFMAMALRFIRWARDGIQQPSDAPPQRQATYAETEIPAYIDPNNPQLLYVPSASATAAANPPGTRDQDEQDDHC